ncbi:helix-turn-helix domain-containing protein [Planctomycetota bacterium]
MNDHSAQEIKVVPRQLVATTERGTKAIADRLAKIRKEQGITQVEMAKKLKTTQSVYSRYEGGEYRLHGELLLTMGKILGVTPNDILGITNSGSTKVPPSEFSVPKRLLRRLRGFDELTRTDQATILRTIEVLMNAGQSNRKKKSAS